MADTTGAAWAPGIAGVTAPKASVAALAKASLRGPEMAISQRLSRIDPSDRQTADGGLAKRAEADSTAFALC
jgi:hypothetical protein